MILNALTGNHPLYQPHRRVRVRRPGGSPPSGLATGDCPGYEPARSEWMRRRQAEIRAQERSEHGRRAAETRQRNKRAA